MDLCIRFWNNEKCRIENRYWSFVFSGYTTYMDIFKVFQSGIKSLDLTRIIQVSMDGPIVNYNFLQKVKDQKKELSSPGLTDFESCNLHTIHGAFKVGVESTAWNLKKSHEGLFPASERSLANFLFSFKLPGLNILRCNNMRQIQTKTLILQRSL